MRGQVLRQIGRRRVGCRKVEASIGRGHHGVGRFGSEIRGNGCVGIGCISTRNGRGAERATRLAIEHVAQETELEIPFGPFGGDLPLQIGQRLQQFGRLRPRRFQFGLEHESILFQLHDAALQRVGALSMIELPLSSPGGKVGLGVGHFLPFRAHPHMVLLDFLPGSLDLVEERTDELFNLLLTEPHPPIVSPTTFISGEGGQLSSGRDDAQRGARRREAQLGRCSGGELLGAFNMSAGLILRSDEFKQRPWSDRVLKKGDVVLRCETSGDIIGFCPELVLFQAVAEGSPTLIARLPRTIGRADDFERCGCGRACEESPRMLYRWKSRSGFARGANRKRYWRAKSARLIASKRLRQARFFAIGSSAK